jgi:hypothetical protein
MRRGIALVGLVAGSLSIFGGVASAAPPRVISTSVTGVTSTGVTLHGSINPEGSPTTFRFEYLTQAAYEANVEANPPQEPFAGALLGPSSGPAPVGSGISPTPVKDQNITNLAPSTAFRYRLRATNATASVVSASRPFVTQDQTNVFELLDHRGWEMVSPVDKGGGAIQAPGAISGGGVFQSAARGGSITYSSADSFGAGAKGVPAGSQYVATRGASGWSTVNITTPLLSGSYGSEPIGVPYQLFSADLGFGLLSNGERCRGMAGGGCPVANPPLPDSGAPAGYRDYYRRNSLGGFESLLASADLQHAAAVSPEEFELRFSGATPDLHHIVLSSCAALTADATEVATPGGCASVDQNLYEWSDGTLSLVNRLVGGGTGSLVPATLAAQSGAISSDGTRIYFTSEGAVYLDEEGETKIVLGTSGGRFEGASSDGSVAYLVDSGDLLRYSTSTGTTTPLTTGGGVEGVLGVSADGSSVYYAKSGVIYMHRGASVTEVASSGVSTDWETGTARVSADGSHLLFLSQGELTGYPNEGETEVFLYGPPPGGSVPILTCVSCNPSGERSQGGAMIPGTRPDGTGAGATDVYRPRVLAASGERVFFETSDSLVAQDNNGGVTDVYEWEADGEGTCTRGGGCVQLISGGHGARDSYFLDADESGDEAFFLTAESLYPLDPGSYDIYDARVGGGFTVPTGTIQCKGDDCQRPPEAPEDPTPGTLVPNSGNPPLHVVGERSKKKKSQKKHRRQKHRKTHRKGSR